MIDHNRKLVMTANGFVRPSKQLFDICAYLAANPGFVRTRNQIMDAVGMKEDSLDRCVDMSISRAKKLGIANIKAIRGMGYTWES